MLTIPGRCWLCRMPLRIPGWGVCSCCQRRRQTPVCPQCGLPAALETLPCGRCLQKPPVWQRLIAASDYAPPVSALVHQFKFHGRTALAPALARLLLLNVLAAKRAAALPARISSSACRCTAHAPGDAAITRAHLSPIRFPGGSGYATRRVP